jgi:hypothetical protein
VQETKKRTKKVFKRVSLEKFGLDGKKEAEFPATTGGRMLLSAKVVTNGKGDIFVCGYYTNSITDQMINGIVVNRINPLTGEVLMSSEKEITASMASKYKDNDNEETDKKENRRARNRRVSRKASLTVTVLKRFWLARIIL